MKSTAASRNSSSTVSIRFFVSGPVSSMRWVPSPLAQVCRTPRGPNFFRNSGILRIVRFFGFLLGVEVIQVAEELVEAVHRRQVLVAVAEVVLAELPGRIALRLERGRDGGILGLQPECRARQAHLGQSGPVGVLAGDERRAAGRAALLAVVVGERAPSAAIRSILRSLVAHHTVAVAAQIALADVVAPDDQNVRLVSHQVPFVRQAGLIAAASVTLSGCGRPARAL